MSLEQTKALFSAMAEHAELIDKLTTVVTETVHYPVKGLDKTLGLLKNAGLVEEVEDDYYMPGENIESLHQLINSSIYADDSPPDLESWKSNFRNTCLNYKSLSEQEITDSSINSLPELQRAATQTVVFTNKIKRQLRNIESDIANNLTRFSRLEDKIRQSNHYLEQLHSLQSEYMTRLNFYDLKKLSTCSDTDRVTLEMDKKLYELRNVLKRVINRVSEFNFHVRSLSKRKAKLNKLYNELGSGNLILDADDLSDKALLGMAMLTDDLKLQSKPQIAATCLGAVEETELDALIARANLEPLLSESFDVKEITADEYYEQRPDIDFNQIDDTFELQMTATTRHLLTTILTRDSSISIMDFWKEEKLEGISSNAWLYVAADKVFELQEMALIKDMLTIKAVQERPSKLSKISILRDLLVENNGGRGGAEP